jgi:hypothetical protein
LAQLKILRLKIDSQVIAQVTASTWITGYHQHLFCRLALSKVQQQQQQQPAVVKQNECF